MKKRGTTRPIATFPPVERPEELLEGFGALVAGISWPWLVDIAMGKVAPLVTARVFVGMTRFLMVGSGAFPLRVQEPRAEEAGQGGVVPSKVYAEAGNWPVGVSVSHWLLSVSSRFHEVLF